MAPTATRATLGTILALAAAGAAACRGPDPADDPSPRRDPYSGACVSAGDGGGDLPSVEYDPDWGRCSSHCDALDEDTCANAPGCRRIFAAPCTGGVSSGQLGFVTCWSRVRGASRFDDLPCRVLGDAAECARRPDCIAVHGHSACGEAAVLLGFQFCWSANEPLPPPPPPPPGGGPTEPPLPD